MSVCYDFARWSYCVDTIHAGRATVLPRKKPALFRSPVSSGCLKKLKLHGPLLYEHRFSTVYPDSMRCLPASLRWGPGVHAVATPGLKTGTMWTRLLQNKLTSDANIVFIYFKLRFVVYYWILFQLFISIYLILQNDILDSVFRQIYY